MIVPINQHWRKKPGVLGPVLGSSLPERHGHTATSSTKGHKYYQGAAAPDVQREDERAGRVQQEREVSEVPSPSV